MPKYEKHWHYFERHKAIQLYLTIYIDKKENRTTVYSTLNIWSDSLASFISFNSQTDASQIRKQCLKMTKQWTAPGICMFLFLRQSDENKWIENRIKSHISSYLVFLYDDLEFFASFCRNSVQEAQKHIQHTHANFIWFWHIILINNYIFIIWYEWHTFIQTLTKIPTRDYQRCEMRRDETRWGGDGSEKEMITMTRPCYGILFHLYSKFYFIFLGKSTQQCHV